MEVSSTAKLGKAGASGRTPWLGRIARVMALVACVLASAPAAAAIETTARQVLLMDATTGAVLYERNADQLVGPASMSKIMTMYIVFERLKEGRIKLDDTLPVSENAWRKGGAASGGSTMFLKLGDRVTIEDLIRGVIVQSGNDASIVLAEGLAGSEEAFAEQMTKRAREMGMANSTFRNATGLPDPEHMTTARDLAILAQRTINDFPEHYHYYGEKEFTYNKTRQGNRNPLLYRNMGADGLKTGHTEASGYGVTASAVRDGRRLILVIHGLANMQSRADETERMMEFGFRESANYALFKAGDTVVDATVWLGAAETVPLTVAKDLVVTLPRKARPNMKVSVGYDGPVPAPIGKGQAVATLTVTAPDVAPIEVPLVAAAEVERLGFFGRIAAAAGHLLGFGGG
jgi:D-alanyl-D-alanine carboxypeptidase (penicillin-binding protein 5/6)